MVRGRPRAPAAEKRISGREFQKKRDGVFPIPLFFVAHAEMRGDMNDDAEFRATDHQAPLT
jgi:hypothetical protein